MKRIIGIDLGTTNSAAAFWDTDEPKMIPNDRGHHLTPSIVSMSPDGDVLVGESAKNQSIVHADRTVFCVKRFMGTDTTFSIDGIEHGPVEISSHILSKIKTDSERFLGERVERAVITVPAHFGEAARAATIEAGTKAGLEVVRVLNEPTAAALCDARRSSGTRRLIVYDLGGGTFDATCLLQEGAQYTVKSTIGESRLGGVDFDELLLRSVLASFEQQSGVDFAAEPSLLQQIRDSVERAKVELSTRETADVSLPFIGTGGKPVHLMHTVTRESFSQLIAPLLRKTVKITLQAIRDAGFGVEGIDSLIVSGGSSRIPLVHTYLKRALGLDEVRMINPDEVVTLGAAVQAGMIEQSADSVHITDVTPHSLGVDTEGGAFVPVVMKNAPIPVHQRRVFTTVADNQSTVEIHVLQGESRVSADNVSLGRFLMSGIRNAGKGEPRIEVSFGVNADGMVQVDARDIDTGVRHNVTIEANRIDSGAADAGLDMDSVAKRVQLFFDRLRNEIDDDLSEEVRYFLREAEHAGHDESRRKEIATALYALADELAAYMDVTEVRNAGA